MTRAFVRVQRAGKWENVEFDQLTDAEMDQFEDRCCSRPDERGGVDPREGWRWAKFLARWIRDNLPPDEPEDEP